jgi:hypothetical protein
MASLYSLQTSLINAHGGNPAPSPHERISKIRRRLKQWWEVIRAFLQKTHAFGGNVIMLQESLGKESAEDCMEFLVEMATTLTQLLEWSKTLAADGVNLAKEISGWVLKFKSILRDSKTTGDRPNFGRQDSKMLTLEPHIIDTNDVHSRMSQP